MNDFFISPSSQDFGNDNLALNPFSVGFAIARSCDKKRMSNDGFYAFFCGREDGQNIFK